MRTSFRKESLLCMAEHKGPTCLDNDFEQSSVLVESPVDRFLSSGRYVRAHAISLELEERFGHDNRVTVLTWAPNEDNNVHFDDSFRFWKTPRIRQEWLDLNHEILRRDDREHKTDYFELFCDLIFVAVIALVSIEIVVNSLLI